MASDRFVIGREQALYGAEALVIFVALPYGVILTISTLYAGIFAIGALPALALAIVGLARPRYFSPVGFTDPRRTVRRYVHFYAALSVVPAFLFLLAVVEGIFRR